MSIDEDAYNLDALPLARPPWPSGLPTFDGAPDPAIDAALPATRSAADVLASGVVVANRWTCRLNAARARAWRVDDRARAEVIVHAIDADPAVPVLLFWMLRSPARFADAIAWLRDAFPQARLALPDDVPSRLRAMLPGVRHESIDASYPAGNWRLLPRAMRASPDAFVLDAIALLDAYDVATRGDVRPERPIAIVAGGVDYHAVDRDTLIATLVAGDEEHVVCAGPRLRERLVASGARVGDGEATVYLVPRLIVPQSPCVRCGWCVQACPTHCDPVALMRLAQVPDARRARAAGLASCIDCGLCSAVCPSRLPLHGLIDALRARLAEREPG